MSSMAESQPRATHPNGASSIDLRAPVPGPIEEKWSRLHISRLESCAHELPAFLGKCKCEVTKEARGKMRGMHFDSKQRSTHATWKDELHEPRGMWQYGAGSAETVESLTAESEPKSAKLRIEKYVKA